jgi:hypothetical protein
MMGNSTLEELVLDRPLIKSAAEDVAPHMAALIQHNTGLRRLSLRKHDMSDFGAERIAEALLANCVLVTLDLGANQIGQDGAVGLAEMLMVNTTLRHVNLDGNRIGDEGCIALATAVVNAPVKSLQSLGVARNRVLGAVGHRTGNVEMSGLLALARAVAATPTITELRVWGNPAVAAVGQIDYQACTELGMLAEKPGRPTFHADFTPYVVDGQMLLAEVEVDGTGRPFY